MKSCSNCKYLGIDPWKKPCDDCGIDKKEWEQKVSSTICDDCKYNNKDFCNSPLGGNWCKYEPKEDVNNMKVIYKNMTEKEQKQKIIDDVLWSLINRDRAGKDASMSEYADKIMKIVKNDSKEIEGIFVETINVSHYNDKTYATISKDQIIEAYNLINKEEK